MKTWHVVIDVAQCSDCNNCLLACKDEHLDNTWPGYALPQPRHGHRWIDILRKERGQHPLIDVAYLPMMCMHCADAPCVKASDGAVQRRPDGIVLIDPVKAKGNRKLVDSCPYHMIWWNRGEQVAQKCTLCAHLLDEGWKQPRCFQSCPTGALSLKCVEEAEMERVVAAEKLEVLNPELNTHPRVHYKNLYRYTMCFIAGSIAIEHDGVADCASGATVTLFRGPQRIAETTTDAFGDFKFDQLPPDGGDYVAEITVPSYKARRVEVQQLTNSHSLGTIVFATAVASAGA